jgi:Ni/Fe-hydrogenase subunit HybB-like protein
VNVAAIGKRVLIVLPSQTHGMLLPYLPGSYVPAWVELSVIAGLFALGTLLYIGTIKIFPILPLSRPGELADA